MTKNSIPPCDDPNSQKANCDAFRQSTGEDGALSTGDDNGPEFLDLPIGDVLDLHSVSPRDAQAVVEEYLHECYRLKLTAIRIVHGRGIGVQRAMVLKVLENTEFVVAFGDAPMEAGGWGATVVTLRRGDSKPG